MAVTNEWPPLPLPIPVAIFPPRECYICRKHQGTNAINTIIGLEETTVLVCDKCHSIIIKGGTFCILCDAFDSVDWCEKHMHHVTRDYYCLPHKIKEGPVKKEGQKDE